MLSGPIVGFVVHHTHYKRIRWTTPNLKPQYKHFYVETKQVLRNIGSFYFSLKVIAKISHGFIFSFH